MKTIIESNDYNEYTVTIQELTKEKAKEIVNRYTFPEAAIASTYTPLSELDSYLVKGYSNALCYYHASKFDGYDNKIMQIRFLRSISNLNLYDAKNLVERVLW